MNPDDGASGIHSQSLDTLYSLILGGYIAGPHVVRSL